MIYLTFPAGPSHQCAREAAQWLLRHGLRQENGLERFTLYQNEYGKPFLYLAPGQSPCFFNLTHCAGLAALCIGRQPVGIDAEPIRPPSPHVIHRVLSKEEQAPVERDATGEVFFRLWTLKESYCKAVGQGLGLPMREISFTFENGRILPGFSGCAFWQKLVRSPDGTKFWLSACRLGEAEDGFLNRAYGMDETSTEDESLLEEIEWTKTKSKA